MPVTSYPTLEPEVRYAMLSERKNAPLNIVLGEHGSTLHRGPGADGLSVVGLKNEQPWHRMAAFMLLAGRTNSEIGMAAQRTIGEVTHLRQQRWFQELLATLGNEHGADLVGILQSEAQESLNKIVSLRDFSENERIQMTAAQYLFDQANGKAVQKVISSVSHSVHATPQDELAEIRQELAMLEQSRKGI